jgi:hypothetical protein
MRGVYVICFVLIVFVPVRAGTGNYDTLYYGTRGYTSLVTDTLAELDLHIPFVPDVEFAAVPELAFQLSLGDFALGMNLGMNFMKPECDGGWSCTVGGIALQGKGRYCSRGEWDICYGGQIEVSYVPGDHDYPDCDFSSGTIGYVTHLRFSRFGHDFSNIFVVSPQGGIYMTNGLFFLQMHFAVEFAFSPEEEWDNDYGFHLGILGSVNFHDRLVVGGGMRLAEFFPVAFAIPTGDLFLRLPLNHVQPQVALSFIFFEKRAVILSVGTTVLF